MNSRRIALGMSAALVALIALAAVVALIVRHVPGARPRAAGTPAPSSHATPAAPPSQQMGQGSVPLGRGGFPGATTTGVPRGVRLRTVPTQVASGPGWHYDPRGWVEVSGDGATLSGLFIPCNLDISASDVTVKDDLITPYGNTFGVSLRHARNVTIEDSTIGSPRPHDRLAVGIKDIWGDSTGTRVLRDNITNTATGIRLESGLIRDNYIHSMGYLPGDHINGITSQGGVTRPLTIVHNTILVQRGQTDAISLFSRYGVQANRTVADNLLAGGGYVIYGGETSGNWASYNIRITGNVFSRIFYPKGGVYGLVSRFNDQRRGNLWAGNQWAGLGGRLRGGPVALP